MKNWQMLLYQFSFFLQAGNYFNHEQNSLIFKRKCSKMSTSFDGGFNVTMEFYIKAVEVQ